MQAVKLYPSCMHSTGMRCHHSVRPTAVMYPPVQAGQKVRLSMLVENGWGWSGVVNTLFDKERIRRPGQHVGWNFV
jgi:hypothetical protein